MYCTLIVSDSKKIALELEYTLNWSKFNVNKVYAIINTTLLDSMIKTFNPQLIVIDESLDFKLEHIATKVLTYKKPLNLKLLASKISNSLDLCTTKIKEPFNLIKEFIDNNYSNPELSTSLVSTSLNLSSGQICKLFKTNANDTLTNYIKSVRINKAIELFSDEALSIESISAKVGYKDRRYFTKIFRSITGSSPTTYRENL